jgi:hypothetical protein
MLEDISCVYCEHWKHAKIRRIKEVEDNPGKGKKKKKKKISTITTKRCSAGSKTRSVEADSQACKYFNPSKLFYCDKNNHFIDPVACINRRRNDKGLKDWDSCKKCHQFNKISQIVQDYYFDLVPVLDPPKRKIKRRANKPDKPKRVIKRRKPKRVIKRRKPKQRKIKRRKK